MLPPEILALTGLCYFPKALDLICPGGPKIENGAAVFAQDGSTLPLMTPCRMGQLFGISQAEIWAVVSNLPQAVPNTPGLCQWESQGQGGIFLNYIGTSEKPGDIYFDAPNQAQGGRVHFPAPAELFDGNQHVLRFVMAGTSRLVEMDGAPIFNGSAAGSFDLGRVDTLQVGAYGGGSMEGNLHAFLTFTQTLTDAQAGTVLKALLNL